MMRGLVLGALLGLVAAPVEAGEITAGKRGGFWCSEITDFEQTIAGKFKETKQQMGPSCRIITGGATIIATLSEKQGEIIMGAGRFEGRENLPFLVLADEPAAAAPADSTAPKRAFKRVAPADVRNSPDKWQGRPIEFADVQVYWIDENEIRVLTNAGVTLFLGKFIGNEDMKHFAKECETEAEALSKKCRASVRFVYSKHMEDNPTSSMTRTVLLSRDAELTRKR